ncbi:MAG: LytTR family transcriptional regulator DNA-binding domain-containing protein [Flavobacteriaceae bacterium]|nr:LytTR family transcriptional regulator DNA-binding domain-containing protein [Flavobacteriaceae bacterium]
MRSKRLLFYAVAMLFLLVIGKSYAINDTIYVGKKNIHINVKKKALIFSSIKKHAILSVSPKNYLLTEDNRDFFYVGFNQKTTAFKINIKNTNAIKRTVYLRFSNAMIYEIKAYKYTANQPKEIYAGGIKYPFKTRTENNRNIVISLELLPLESTSYLVSFQKVVGRPLVTSVDLFDDETLKRKSFKEYFLIAVYTGLSIICVLVGVGLFFFLKTRLFLLYALYVLFLGLFIISYTGVFQQFLLNENSTLNKYLHYVVFSEAALVVFVVFSQKFLKAKTRQPKLYQLIKWILIVAVVLRLALHFFLQELFLEYISMFMKVWYELNILGASLVAYQIISLYRKEKKTDFLFATAYLLMILGALISVLYHSYGLVNGLFFGLPILLITSLLEILLLTLALSMLVKEIIDQRKELLHTIKKQELQNTKAYIELKSKNRVYLESLIYIKSEGNYLEFFTEQEKYLDRNQLKKVLEELPVNFVKIHRSYIINKNYIKLINSTSVVLTTEVEIPLSRTFKKNL